VNTHSSHSASSNRGATQGAADVRAQRASDRGGAFGEIDRLASEMVRTGALSDAVELVVVNATDRLVDRPGVQ
jgi:hypothetical protein